MSDGSRCPVCGLDGALKQGSATGSLRSYDCPRCGRYFIDPLDADTGVIDQRFSDKRHILSALVRRASDAGQPLEINRDRIPVLLESVSSPRSMFEHMDLLLEVLASRATRYLGPIQLNAATDYPLLHAHDDAEMGDFLRAAAELGYFDAERSTITVEGWNRIEALRQSRPNSRQAFVAMWFDRSLDDAWLNGFTKGIEDTTYFTAIRIDSVQHNEKIDDRIIAEIRRSGLVVADFTGGRGGVYFEAGFALGLGIPVIWTCRADDKDNLHFDTRQYNHILWEGPEDLRRQLRDRIAATVLPRRGGPM